MAGRALPTDLHGLDAIKLRNMVFQARHGCTSAERELGALFSVSVELYLDTRKAAESDNLEDTAHVAEIYETVLEIVTGPSRNLLEAVAEDMAEALLERFNIEAVKVKISKDRVPMPGPTAGYEVEILRR